MQPQTRQVPSPFTHVAMQADESFTPADLFFEATLLQAKNYDHIKLIMGEKRHLIDATFLRELDSDIGDARWTSYSPGEAGETAAERLQKLLDIQAAAYELTAHAAK